MRSASGSGKSFMSRAICLLRRPVWCCKLRGIFQPPPILTVPERRRHGAASAAWRSINWRLASGLWIASAFVAEAAPADRPGALPIAMTWRRASGIIPSRSIAASRRPLYPGRAGRIDFLRSGSIPGRAFLYRRNRRPQRAIPACRSPDSRKPPLHPTAQRAPQKRPPPRTNWNRNVPPNTTCLGWAFGRRQSPLPSTGQQDLRSLHLPASSRNWPLMGHFCSWRHYI